MSFQWHPEVTNSSIIIQQMPHKHTYLTNALADSIHTFPNKYTVPLTKEWLDNLVVSGL